LASPPTGAGPGHGYELLERSGEPGYGAGVGPGSLYRTLRGMEEEGLVESSRDTAGGGPARRM